MKYINKFSTNADYQAFTEGGGYVTPNICYVEETDGLVFKPEINEIIISTFTISDKFNMYPSKTYNFEEGMTFEEFCNSSYNIDNWKVVSPGNGMTYVSHQYNSYVSEEGFSVRPYDVIKLNGEYDYNI